MTEGRIDADEPVTDEQPAPRPDVDLAEFLRILPHLETADLMAMSAAYDQADEAARNTARAAASAAARQRRLMDQLGELQGSIIQWAGSSISQSGVMTLEAVFQTDQMLGDVRRQAMPPLLDAATALLLGDALEPGAREALLEPWSSAIS
jgi:hypothetical protein